MSTIDEDYNPMNPPPSEYLVPDLTPSAVCAFLPTRYLLTGLFRDVMTKHFADASNIQHEALRALLWKQTDDTGILVESVLKWQPQTTERRPAILIKPNSMQNTRRGIGDRRQGPATDKSGNPVYSTFWVGSHTLFCIGGTGAQVEYLQCEVQRELTQFGPEIAKALNLLRFQVLEVGEVGEVEEATENFIVPVTIGWAYEERWVVNLQAPRLKVVSLTMILDS